MKLIGKSPVTDREFEGRKFRGMTISIAEEIPNWEGVRAKSVFINTGKCAVPPGLSIGDDISVYYDEFKKPAAIVINDKTGK